MYKNIKDLMKNGKVDEALITRGGAKFMYNMFYFVKTAKNKINVYKGNTWEQGKYTRKPVAKLTNEYIMICPRTASERYNREPGPNNNRKLDIWDIGSFLSLNLLYNGYTRYSRNYNIVCVNGIEFIPFSKRMKFDWNGNLLSKIPKWANEEYNNYLDMDKSIKNRMSRARYHDKQAIKRYEAAGNDLEFVPISDVFKHRNSDRRRRLIAHFGIEQVLSPYNQNVMDKDTINGNSYELVQITIPLANESWENGVREVSDDKLCTYLKMINPSTGEYHLEGVATKDDNSWDHIADLTVKSALAWRDGENQPGSRTIPFDSNVAEHDGGLSDYVYIEPKTLT
tara:strand:- start:246 stop:1265 length:1020 start_codon:yes stop_codon:yes gene_type:complete